MAGRWLRAVVVAAPLLLGVLAGCVGSKTDLSAKLPVHDHSMMMPMWTVQLSDCHEGGFVAAVPMNGQYVVEPWERVDIRNELGNPKASGASGPLSGNWHQGIKCKEATQDGVKKADFQLGYIGDVVKAPSWDPGGADVHFLISGFGMSDSPIRDTLTELSIADVSHAVESRIDWLGPAAVYEVYSDQEKGVYDSYSPVTKIRDSPERTIRFWWTVPANGSRLHHDHGHADADMVTEEPVKGFHPVYWDIHTTGGTQWASPEIIAPGCHSGTQDHGPQGRLCQPIVTNLYDHKTLAITYGGVIESVTLKDEWVH